MQRITVPILLTITAIVSGTALVSSATQSERSPILPEVKQEPGGPVLPPPKIPTTPEPKEPNAPPPNEPGSPHIPIPPEIKPQPGTLPPPQNFIMLNGQKLIASGGAEVVFTVPDDSFLVLTDLETDFPKGGAPALAERMGGLTTDKRSTFLGRDFHSMVGIAFQPGSQVLLRESSLQGPVTISFSFSGMLVKQ